MCLYNRLPSDNLDNEGQVCDSHDENSKHNECCWLLSGLIYLHLHCVFLFILFLSYTLSPILTFIPVTHLSVIISSSCSLRPPASPPAVLFNRSKWQLWPMSSHSFYFLFLTNAWFLFYCSFGLTRTHTFTPIYLNHRSIFNVFLMVFPISIWYKGHLFFLLPNIQMCAAWQSTRVIKALAVIRGDTERGVSGGCNVAKANDFQAQCCY